MSSVGAIIILAGLSGPVDTPRLVWPAPAGIQQPPAKWAKRPDVPYKVQYGDVKALCKNIIGMKPMVLLGCTTPPKGKTACLINLQSGMPPDLEDAVLKHEIGHCKGWPPDHPLK